MMRLIILRHCRFWCIALKRSSRALFMKHDALLYYHDAHECRECWSPPRHLVCYRRLTMPSSYRITVRCCHRVDDGFLLAAFFAPRSLPSYRPTICGTRMRYRVALSFSLSKALLAMMNVCRATCLAMPASRVSRGHYAEQCRSKVTAHFYATPV